MLYLSYVHRDSRPGPSRERPGTWVRDQAASQTIHRRRPGAEQQHPVSRPPPPRRDGRGKERARAAGSEPTPRVYRLTDHGLDVLRGFVEDFPQESALNDGEFNTRLAYFELIDPSARLEILRTRAAAVENLLDHLRRSLVETTAQGRRPYAPRLIEFLIAQRESELRFLEILAREEEGKEDLA